MCRSVSGRPISMVSISLSRSQTDGASPTVAGRTVTVVRMSSGHSRSAAHIPQTNIRSPGPPTTAPRDARAPQGPADPRRRRSDTVPSGRPLDTPPHAAPPAARRAPQPLSAHPAPTDDFQSRPCRMAGIDAMLAGRTTPSAGRGARTRPRPAFPRQGAAAPPVPALPSLTAGAGTEDGRSASALRLVAHPEAPPGGPGRTRAPPSRQGHAPVGQPPCSTRKRSGSPDGGPRPGPGPLPHADPCTRLDAAGPGGVDVPRPRAAYARRYGRATGERRGEPAAGCYLAGRDGRRPGACPAARGRAPRQEGAGGRPRWTQPRTLHPAGRRGHRPAHT